MPHQRRRTGFWRHECVGCHAIFFGSRCQIACDPCRAAGAARARGRCLVCERRVRPLFLFCKECRHERWLGGIRRAKSFHHTSSIVATPTYEDDMKREAREMGYAV